MAKSAETDDISEQRLEQLLTRAAEVISRNEKTPGKFYRYVDIDSVIRLLEKGTIEVSGEARFANAVAKKFNPTGAHASIILPYYFLHALSSHVVPIDTIAQDSKKLLQNKEDYQTVVEKVEQKLVTLDKKYSGLTAALQLALEQSSTTPLIAYVKRVAGEPAMIALERSGWDIGPYAAFSDLIPLSVGAPLGEVVGSKMVVLEIDLKGTSVIIPPDDRNNEHEVLTRKIRKEDVRGVYAEKNWRDLIEKLKSKYPQHFYGENVLEDLFRNFARQKPLSELLKELKIGSV